MEIVPVLDLKQGQVVRARRGARAAYRPIETPLSPTSRPLDVAQGLLHLHPFATLYVADLDAIEGTGDNRAAIAELHGRFPDTSLWVDNGTCEGGALEAWWAEGLGDLVLGSETQKDIELVRRMRTHERIVLSLDFRGDDFQGPRALLDEPGHWPRRIIAMTLGRVGSSAGPDFGRLSRLREVAPDRSFFAAGGIRDAGDLGRLAQIGVAGALVASCLHDGRVGTAELSGFV